MMKKLTIKLNKVQSPIFAEKRPYKQSTICTYIAMCRMQIFCRRSVSMLLTMMAMATITTIKMTKMLTMTMMKEKMKKKRKKRKANIVERNSRAPSSCRPFIYQDRIPLPQSSVWYFFVFYCCICVFVCWFASYFIYIKTAFPCLPPCLPRSVSVAFHFSVLLYLCVGLYHIPCKTEFRWLSSILPCSPTALYCITFVMHFHLFASVYLCNSVPVFLCNYLTVVQCICVSL